MSLTDVIVENNSTTILHGLTLIDRRHDIKLFKTLQWNHSPVVLGSTWVLNMLTSLLWSIRVADHMLMIYEINQIWPAEMKWRWRNDRRSEHNLCNCVKKPEKKIQDFNGVWTRDLAIPVRCSTNWAMKPLTLGEGQLWVHMFPWKKWLLMIYEINHMWTVEMKWRWRNDRLSERTENCCWFVV